MSPRSRLFHRPGEADETSTLLESCSRPCATALRHQRAYLCQDETPRRYGIRSPGTESLLASYGESRRARSFPASPRMIGSPSFAKRPDCKTCTNHVYRFRKKILAQTPAAAPAVTGFAALRRKI